MRTILVTKGLDIPISGSPSLSTCSDIYTGTVGLVGDDYIGMKPSFMVAEGDRVLAGQTLFTDKKNEGVCFVSPASGYVQKIVRGAKRKFESISIKKEGHKKKIFLEKDEDIYALDREKILSILIESGLWTSFRTRPYGKIPQINSQPQALFITATDTRPLAAPPQAIIEQNGGEYSCALFLLRKIFSCPIYYCSATEDLLAWERVEGIESVCFKGAHPSGLASTHIHFLNPVSEEKSVWHIDYQDIIAMGYLFQNGFLSKNRTIALGGSGVLAPSLVRVPVGANIDEACLALRKNDDTRIISGSVLCGRMNDKTRPFLGRYHNQISILEESDGRSLFNWMGLGRERYSALPLFASSLQKKKKHSFNTAMWGGERAIYPLAEYERLIPLDILATPLLKSLAQKNTDLSKDLGCLELIEEDLALCSFVCAGKNDCMGDLRQTLNAIEQGE